MPPWPAESPRHAGCADPRLRILLPERTRLPSFGAWTDQPFLDEVTWIAIEILSAPRADQPFILMVEAALIDKQSVPTADHDTGAMAVIIVTVISDVYGTDGIPDYIHADGDGYPDNRQVGGKRRRRLVGGYERGGYPARLARIGRFPAGPRLY